MSKVRKLRERVTFAARAVVDDGYGNETGGWADQFTVWAGITYLRGSEAVIASRLEGKQPAVIRVRVSPQTRVITADWRVTDTRTGEIYNIATKVETPDRVFFDLTATSGVAV
ncbi:phage head closure protein [Aureimonas altamirensis]|uniref:phage head closure protein n=1 Tax=Aureimonas altamirensis TaxID=370622 RepID=UPI001E6370C1|nr:phage head closure protein [Aureimonas altamirensis]UHD44916.1 phage head closure protein [Aureimonas altamirensis]